VARAQALAWFEQHNLPPKADLEIELAIPAHMGLGSEAMLDLTVARGLEALNGPENVTGLESVHSIWEIEAWSHSKGGLIVAGRDGRLIQRHALEHNDENAWVFVIHLPRPTADTSPSLETDLRYALLRAEPTTDIEPLWSAVEANDAQAAGAALMTIQAETRAALEKAGTPQIISEAAAQMLEMIRTSRNILAWGQSFGGLATWGLIKGAGPSQEARTRMRRVAGYEGGTILASVTSNTGLQVKTV
jgi:predicted sugar kinase